MKYIDQLVDINTNCIYFVSEYCQNGDLHSYYKKNKNISKNEIINIISDILKGLISIHAKNIIHGDLNPYNILLSEEFTAQISDLGLTIRNTSSKNYLNDIGGTYAYQSNE